MAAVINSIKNASPRNNVCAPAVVEEVSAIRSPDDIAEVFHIMTWGKGDVSTI